MPFGKTLNLPNKCWFVLGNIPDMTEQLLTEIFKINSKQKIVVLKFDFVANG